MALKPITVNTPPAQAAHILAEDDAALYEGIIGGDCVLPIGGKLNASVISNNKVRITDGVVVVGGHIARIEKGDYEDMTIANGVSGKNRNDIIVARFIAGSSGGVDSYKIVVVQGASGTTATDPTIVRGDLYNGDKQRDCPLWRIKIEGISVVKVEQMHEIGSTSRNLLERIVQADNSIATLNRNMLPTRTLLADGLAIYGYGNMRILHIGSCPYSVLKAITLLAKDRPAETMYTTVLVGGYLCNMSLSAAGKVTAQMYANYAGTASIPQDGYSITGQIVWAVL